MSKEVLKQSLKNKILCPICKGKKQSFYWAMSGYRLAKCLSCGFVWDHYHAENVLAQYDKNYFQNDNPKGGYANYFEGMRINRKTFIDRLSKVEKKLGKKGKLLDVGCALGDCLDTARNKGWKDIHGVEVSVFAAKFAKERKLNVLNKTLKEAKFKSNTFDAILYQDVIEHVDDPINELSESYRILKKGGIIFLVTPDVGGWWHSLLKSKWYHYKPGEHIMYFTEKSLELALKNAGFKKIKTRKTYHVLSLEYVFNRLKYYSPFIFETLLKVVTVLNLKEVSFKAYTGEIEAWGEK